MAVKFSIQKVPKIHLFQQRKQRHSFQNVLLTPTVAIATALSVNCPHLLRQSLTSLRLRLRLMTSKRCSSRDETLQPLVQTASPTLCGKRCQCLHRPLYSIIRRVWSSANIPASWQCATIRLFHKSGSTNDPSNFRPIALSNCEGKVFFSLVSKAVLRHMLRNLFFDKRLQKGFLPDVAGCLEHSSLLSDALRDARAHQRSICISWLDLKMRLAV